MQDALNALLLMVWYEKGQLKDIVEGCISKVLGSILMHHTVSRSREFKLIQL